MDKNAIKMMGKIGLVLMVSIVIPYLILENRLIKDEKKEVTLVRQVSVDPETGWVAPKKTIDSNKVHQGSISVMNQDPMNYLLFFLNEKGDVVHKLFIRKNDFFKNEIPEGVYNVVAMGGYGWEVEAGKIQEVKVSQFLKGIVFIKKNMQSHLDIQNSQIYLVANSEPIQLVEMMLKKKKEELKETQDQQTLNTKRSFDRNRF